MLQEKEEKKQFQIKKGEKQRSPNSPSSLTEAHLQLSSFLLPCMAGIPATPRRQ
jgi:hypothetical protein